MSNGKYNIPFTLTPKAKIKKPPKRPPIQSNFSYVPPAPTPVGHPSSYSASTKRISKKDGLAAAYAFRHAVEENIRPEHRERLAPILAATRVHENARPGKEFGVLSSRAVDTKYKGSKDPRLATAYRTQAGWSAATLQKNLDRYTEKHPNKPEGFLKFYAGKYAPQGVENDPDNLNANWFPSVDAITKSIRSSQVRRPPVPRSNAIPSGVQRFMEKEARRTHTHSSNARLSGIQRWREKEWRRNH